MWGTRVAGLPQTALERHAHRDLFALASSLPLPQTQIPDMDSRETEKPATQHREARFAENTKHEGGGGPLQKTLTNTSDTEKGSSAYVASTTGLDHRIESHRAELRLLFKLGE